MPFDFDDPYVEIACEIRGTSPKAVKVELTVTKTTHWIPRSCLHGGQERRIEESVGEALELKVRRWFAEKESLL
jgi:hypothetical protein